MSRAEYISESDQLLFDLFNSVISRSLGERLVSELSNDEITYPQAEVLKYIHLHPGATIGNISRGVRVSFPSATNMISRLVRKGLVEKQPDPDDGRAILVSLTDCGARFVRSIDQARADKFRSIFQNLEPDQRDSVLGILGTFVQAALESNIANLEDNCLHCGKRADPSCPLVKMHGPDICT